MQQVKKILKAFLILICFSFSVFCVRVYAQTSVLAFSSWITTAEYCDFLNHVAASDPNHLFDQKMSADSDTACIIRTGAPGSWHYEVIAGRENFPVKYVSYFNEVIYCNYTSSIVFEGEQNDDDLLKSNLTGFQVDRALAPSLTLATEPVVNSILSSISAYPAEFFEITGLAAFGLGLVTLRDFRDALANPANTRAERLVIHGDPENEVIRAETAGSRSQNLYIRDQLINALGEEHTSESAEAFVSAEIGALRLMTERSSRMSMSRLHRIITAADASRVQSVPPSLMIEMSFNKDPRAMDAPMIRASHELTRKAFDIFFKHQQRNKKNDISSQNESIATTAQRYFRYLANGEIDATICNSAISPKGLAAIDRAEEAWRLRLIDESSSSSICYLMEKISIYYSNSLAAERNNLQKVASYWEQAADQLESAIYQLQLIIPYLANHNKCSEESRQVIQNFTNTAELIVKALAIPDEGNEAVTMLLEEAIKQSKAALYYGIQSIKAWNDNNIGKAHRLSSRPYTDGQYRYLSDRGSATYLSWTYSGGAAQEATRAASNFIKSKESLQKFLQLHDQGNQAEAAERCYQAAVFYQDAADISIFITNALVDSDFNIISGIRSCYYHSDAYAMKRRLVNAQNICFIGISEKLEQLAQLFANAADTFLRGENDQANILIRDADAAHQHIQQEMRRAVRCLGNIRSSVLM